jgi:GAF domain-containing protein
MIMPGADLVSVTLRTSDGTLSTPVGTDPLADMLDQAQYRENEGPCVEAARPDGPAYAVSDDLAAEARWPRFTEAAVRHGIGAVLSTDLMPAERGAVIGGALNVYSRKPHGLSTYDRHAALLLATHASLALARSQATELAELQSVQLRQAIQSRDVIGQAKGILMARQNLTADEAFDLLRRTSQDLNIKLVDLATTLTSRHTELGDLC